MERVVKEGDLSIRDLGYFKIESLRKIDRVRAYFLSRFPSHVKVYLNPEDKTPTDLARHLNKHYKNNSAIDLKVWISEQRLEVRLVAYRTPKDVTADRLRIVHKKAKEMGRTPSKEKITLQEFSIFITNIPVNMISKEIIGTIYRLRWEIELIFKTWKSHLKIDVLNGICLQRILCLMWGRLCMVLILAHITANFMNLAYNLYERELSPVKLINYLLRNDIFCRAIKTQTLKDFERELIQDIMRRLLKNKRSRKTMRERAYESSSYYEWGAYA